VVFVVSALFSPRHGALGALKLGTERRPAA